MKAWRIRFYVVSVVIIVVLSILNSRKESPRRTQRWHAVQRIRPKTERNSHVSVLAPWTKLPRGQNVSKTTRSFVLADIAKVDIEFGVPMTSLDQKHLKMIREQLEARLCLRSDKRSISYHATRKCKRNVEILQCVTCTEQDGMWYSAVSQTGAAFGQIQKQSITVDTGDDANQIMRLYFPNYNDGPFMYEQLDIAVPIAGQDDKLRRFAARLRPSIRQFRSGMYGSKITIRLLVTRFSFDDPSPGDNERLEAFRQNLTEMAGLTSLEDEVVFVPVSTNSSEFNRAKAINALHQIAHHDDNSVLAVIDVDLSVGPKFLRNALAFPFPQAAAYFPIMFSEFNPDAVKVVDQFFPSMKKYKFSDHHGHWRKFSYGMYVIAGSDAPRLTMDESFVGW
jgi:Chondroitin N-acetylgalactosaminyltransferase